ncbi:MAG: prevent-host-death protein [Alteromonadaceae bacterium]|nr:MAG: prevent-host-death protein [Alteromonadaceae bacterium]
MFSARDIHSLTDFQRNAKDHVQRLTDTKRPEILTVNGKAQLVVQDAQAYEEMVELLYSLKQISKSVKDSEDGRTKPLDDAFSDIKQRLLSKYPNAKI